MVVDFNSIGRLSPEDIHEGKIFYHCYAGISEKFMAAEDPFQDEDGVWVWKAIKPHYKKYIKNKTPFVVFRYQHGYPNNPYLFSYPASVNTGPRDQSIIY